MRAGSDCPRVSADRGRSASPRSFSARTWGVLCGVPHALSRPTDFVTWSGRTHGEGRACTGEQWQVGMAQSPSTRRRSSNSFLSISPRANRSLRMSTGMRPAGA